MGKWIAAKRGLRKFLVALTLATVASTESAAEVTYIVDRTVSSGRITGTIVTNGNTGALAVTDILDWNLTVDADGNAATTGKLLGPASGSNSSLTFLPIRALTATATALFFDFSLYAPPPGPPLPGGPPGIPANVQFVTSDQAVVWQLQGGYFSDELIRETGFPLVQAHAVRPPAPDQIAAAGPPPPLAVTTDMTMTDDRLGSIVIEADNLTLDCAGHAVQGGGTGVGIGIHLAGRMGVNVTGCVVTGFAQGIVVENSSRNSIARNTVKRNTDAGIVLSYSRRNTVIGNFVSDNAGGPLTANGIVLASSSYNEVHFNTVTGTESTGIPLVDRSAWNTLIGNVSSNNGATGFHLIDVSNNTLSRNIAVGNGDHGFFSQGGSERNTLRENTACLNSPVDARDERAKGAKVNVWVGNLLCTK